MQSNKIYKYVLKYNQQTLNKKLKIVIETKKWILTKQIINKKFENEIKTYYLKLLNFFY